MMNYKELITFSIIPWINVLMLYALNFFKIEYTLIGVYHELTMLPSLLLGCIFPLLLVIKFFRSF
ncbi:hypothetical protein OAU94_03780 [Flavobacteriaceae bacterium]|jgi:hypothetical protein|nr:hypothetical protein [Flavobacteriaceae bacterium]